MIMIFNGLSEWCTISNSPNTIKKWQVDVGEKGFYHSQSLTSSIFYHLSENIESSPVPFKKYKIVLRNIILIYSYWAVLCLDEFKIS